MAPFCENLPLKHSEWHMLTRITLFYLPPTRLSMNGMSHSAFTLLSNYRASLQFGWYSFSITLRVGG